MCGIMMESTYTVTPCVISAAKLFCTSRVALLLPRLIKPFIVSLQYIIAGLSCPNKKSTILQAPAEECSRILSVFGT
jgi:hypothetical protein